MTLTLHNTLTRKVEAFSSHTPGEVKLYTCGPTVYNYLHVGNWAAYIYWDTLVRTLQASDYRVERVMNITDVGHLTSDADDGEDKLEKGARREGKTAWEVAQYYGDDFLAGMNRLNLIEPTHITKATEYIDEQLELVRRLKAGGFTYQIDDGIYFDTSKFPAYANFAGLDLDAQKAGARVEFNLEKRNPSDFALWKFTPAGETRDMEWDTPADLLESDDEDDSVPEYLQPELDQTPGLLPSAARSHSGTESFESSFKKKPGFPGWHLECSAMAMSILGDTLDIHTGGIDHIPVHHTNEIAQSEAASGKQFSKFWIHNNHIQSGGTKISKSLGNGYTLDDLEQRGFSPMDYRMFVLQSHYRSEANFTFENLEAARNRLANWRTIAALRHQIYATTTGSQADQSSDDTVPSYAAASAVHAALNNDLATPQALQLIDEVFNELARLPAARIYRHAFINLLEMIDQLLGLNLLDSTPDISDDAKQLILGRQHARANKDWVKSDGIRAELEALGITVRDTATGPIWEYTD